MRSRFYSIQQAMERGQQASLSLQVGGQRYVRRFLPPERLILLGGGHVSLAVYEAASALDFSVTVADDRPAFARQSRFPRAKVVCGAFEETVAGLQVGPGDYVCILTRGHESDMVCLRALLQGSEPRYLGMIGSRRRMQGIRELLLKEGVDENRLGRLHGPIGLSIGAVTPAEIAVSICAELILARHEQDKEPGVLPQQNTDLTALSLLADDSQRAAMLLVLSARGSTPVKGGALMALNEAGAQGGTIGGGPGEGEALAVARECMKRGETRVITVDMTGQVAAETGLVCGGVMEVLIEALPAGEA